jgi:hypothetical protein
MNWHKTQTKQGVAPNHKLRIAARIIDRYLIDWDAGLPRTTTPGITPAFYCLIIAPTLMHLQRHEK